MHRVTLEEDRGAGRRRSTVKSNRPTVKDVAKAAGVALSTASRALTDHPDVSQEMRERVAAAARLLDYEPDFLAQSLRTGKTQTIGLLVADLTNPIFADVVRGACDWARARGYAALLTNSDGRAEVDAEYLQLFLRRRVDGVILMPASGDRQEIAAELADPKVPMLAFDCDPPPGSAVSSVLWDHASGFHEAVSSLISHGHADIGFIGGSDSHRPIRERLAGYQDALWEAGIAEDASLIRLGPVHPTFAREATLELLARSSQPTALVVGANRLLPGVLEALHSAQVAAGRDLALVSADDIELARLHQPPISVVTRNTYRMGQLAVRTLLERIEDPSAPVKSIVLASRFVERASSSWDRG
jgi:LacI family transcriptional regulator